jgi:hypothetical protein
MDSESLKALGFGGWLAFNKVNSAVLVAGAPTMTGVYAIRCRTAFARVSGVSNILYVGAAGSQDGLRMRFKQYFKPGPTQATNKRLLARCGDNADHEISYVVCESRQAAYELEAAILKQYVLAHHELPPENRVLPRAPGPHLRAPTTTGAAVRAPMTEQPSSIRKSQMPNFTSVWNRIEAHAGDEFTTVTGKAFTFVVEHGAVRTSRTNRQIPRSDFEKALALVPLENTVVLQDLQGPSYVYAILMDERVRAGEW